MYFDVRLDDRNGADGGTQTPDHSITSRTLYQLSYIGLIEDSRDNIHCYIQTCQTKTKQTRFFNFVSLYYVVDHTIFFSLVGRQKIVSVSVFFNSLYRLTRMIRQYLIQAGANAHYLFSLYLYIRRRTKDIS